MHAVTGRHLRVVTKSVTGQGSTINFVLGDEGWMAHAECRGSDPEMFFPGRGEDTGDAKQVCAVCPVRSDCLEYAMARGEKFGVWGGLSEKERRRLRSRRARIRALIAEVGEETAG